MRISSHCYVEHDGQYLMLHRVKKEVDWNKGKWCGIGGGFEKGEGPEDCIRREAMEETGLTLGNLILCSVVTFILDNADDEIMFLFKCCDFTGCVGQCDEGVLEWVPIKDVFSLNLWEGDRIFLDRITQSDGFFTLKLVYDEKDELIYAEENGKDVILDRRQTN